jgi:DNA-binding transcriptional ArsR family regulator
MLTKTEIGKVRQGVRDIEERIPFLFQALSDATRLKIFRLLVQHKDLCVTDLANICNISVPAVSYQLKLMEVVGLVRKERMGKMICYELKKEDPLVKKLMGVIT